MLIRAWTILGPNFVSSTYGYGTWNCKVFAMFYSNIWKVNFENKNTCMALFINRFPFLLLSTVGKKQISLAFSHVLINNALLHHFLANWLAHNKKTTEKSVFLQGLEFWNDVTIVPSVLFWVSRFCTSPKVIWHFWYIKTWGRNNNNL